MALNTRSWLNAPVITTDITDSTNNDAMRLIDADKALHGTMIVAEYQTAGRGQRGRTWEGHRDKSLLMSIIVSRPPFQIDSQFLFSALIAVGVADAISQVAKNINPKIKWPNDLIVDDKKAGGILIENVLRGHRWEHAVVGLGINLNGTEFGEGLTHATSLKIATGKTFGRLEIAQLIRASVFSLLDELPSAEEIMHRYNTLLFKRGEVQVFLKDSEEWKAKIVAVQPDGRLQVQTNDGTLSTLVHGTVTWKY